MVSLILSIAAFSLEKKSAEMSLKLELLTVFVRERTAKVLNKY